MTLPKNGASFPSITCGKRKGQGEHTSLADAAREGPPFLYATGQPLMISQQPTVEKAQDFAPKELAYPLQLGNEDAQAPFVFLLLQCGVGHGEPHLRRPSSE